MSRGANSLPFHTGFIEDFDAGHIGMTGARVAEIEREEVKVIVDTERVAVIFGIATDQQVLSTVEH